MAILPPTTWLNIWQGAQQNWVDGWLSYQYPVVFPLPGDTPLERTRFMPPRETLPFAPDGRKTISVPAVPRILTTHEDGRMLKFPFKDPDERDDFKLNWAPRLVPIDVDDEVYESLWTIVTDMTEDLAPLNIYDQDIISGNLATRVWLEGGSEGSTYELLNEVLTVGNRTLQQTVQIKVKSR